MAGNPQSSLASRVFPTSYEQQWKSLQPGKRRPRPQRRKQGCKRPLSKQRKHQEGKSQPKGKPESPAKSVSSVPKMRRLSSMPSMPHLKMTLRVSLSLFLSKGRSPMSAVNVGESLNTRQITFATREFTLERSPLSVTSAGRPSGTAQMSPSIKESTPVRSPSNVASVERPSTVAPTF